MRAVCPGSFDPATAGHVDIIERAAVCFDEVIVAVGQNSAKNHMFSAAERVDLMRLACAHLPTVTVSPLHGLLVDFCREHGAPVIVKGVRSCGDFEYEVQMAQWNKELEGIETLLLPAAAKWSYLSSTKVREVASLGGDVRRFVPAAIAEQVQRRVADLRRPEGQ